MTEHFDYIDGGEFTGSLEERVFILRVEALEIEYGGKPNKLVNICADSRFIEAKREIIEKIGEVRANNLFHKIFNQL